MSGDYLNWVVMTGQSTGRRATAVEVPTSDQMIFGAYIPQTTVYSYGAPPQTIPAHWATTADCTLTQEASIQRDGLPYFPGITMLNTYVGEVDLRQSAVVDDLDVYGGRFKQNDLSALGGADPNAGTLRVDLNLDWTDGTINSNSVSGFLNLAPQATGTIHPDDGNDGDVDLGSTFTMLENTSTTLQSGELEIQNGTINLKRGNGFHVQKRRVFKCAPVPKLKLQEVTAEIRVKDEKQVIDKGQLTIDPEAKAVVTQTEDPATGYTAVPTVKFEGKVPKLTNKDTVELTKRAKLLFNPDAKTNNGESGFYQNDDAAVLRMEGGTTIECKQDVYVRIFRGTFEMAVGGPNNRIDIQADTKTSNALLIGTRATLKRAVPPEATATNTFDLQIQGNLTVFGTVELYAKRGANENDSITVTNYALFDNAAKLRLKWIDPQAAPRDLGLEWTLVTSSDTSTGDMFTYDTSKVTFEQPDPENRVGKIVLTPQVYKKTLTAKRTS